MPATWEPVLQQLVAERFERLLTRAMLLTGSRADAEDLVQDALVATFASRARFQSVEPAEAYVRRAIATRFLNRLRGGSREAAALSAAVSATGSPDDGGLGTDVEAAMARLAPRARACVYLRHLEGLSVAETAAALGLSDGAVKRYTSEGLGELSVLLQAHWRPTDDHVPVVTRTEVRPDA